MLDFMAQAYDSLSMFEMYFVKEIDSQKLCDAISKHLFVRREDVGVVPLTQIDTKGASVVLEDMEGGEFPYGVTVHTELTWFSITELELAQKLCATLDTKCLIADDGDDPYRWILVTDNSTNFVYVNRDLFDGQCVFKIESILS